VQKLGKKQLHIELNEVIDELPDSLDHFALSISDDNKTLVYTYETRGGQRTGITKLLSAIHDSGLQLQDIQTSQSSLEDIFVDLVSDDAEDAQAVAETREQGS